MGAKTSTENRVKVINDTVTDVMLKTFNKCKNEASSSQVIEMECNPSIEMVKLIQNSPACLTQAEVYKDKGITEPPSACFACVQTDITQESIITYDAKCKNKTINHNEMRQKIKNALEQQADAEVKGFGAPFSKTESENISEQINKISQGFSNEVINESLGKLSTAQQISMKGTGGLQSYITQKTAASMVSQSISENEVINKSIIDLANLADQLAKAKSTGPIVGTLEAIFGNISKTVMFIVIALIH